MAAAKPLKFCIVSTFYPPYNFGGDGIYAHRLANGLARLGHQVTVLHSPSAYEMAAKRTPAEPYADHENVTVRPIRTPLGALGLLAVQQTGRPCFQGPALRQWLDRGEFDVIHYNNVSLLGGPHVFRYGTGLKLCTLIEHWLVCPMHVLWKFDREVCTKPSCLACTLHGKRPPQLWRYTGLMKRATRSIDAFIGPSLFTMQMHRERGLRGTMIQLPLFHPEPAAPMHVEEVKPARPYFLFVGRLEKIKGVQTIIPVFRGLSDVDLVIAGGGTYEAELRKLAAGATNIRFVGRQSHDQLQALYRGAVANVVPSLCYETFGIIVAESFSANTPVIVRAQSSLKEIVSTHGGGLTFTNDEELRGAIEKLRSDPALRETLARQGRAAYDAEFAEAPFLQHYLEVVRGLLAAKQTKRAIDRTTVADSSLFAGRPVLFGQDC
jgi:glycosyltransferase involved in cell wall biosynthesis